jgi:hypothetical protein
VRVTVPLCFDLDDLVSHDFGDGVKLPIGAVELGARAHELLFDGALDVVPQNAPGFLLFFGDHGRLVDPMTQDQSSGNSSQKEQVVGLDEQQHNFASNTSLFL